MSKSQRSLNITDEQESSLSKLASAIEDFQGEFMLIFAHCNYVSLRERLVQRLRQLCPIETVILQPSDTTLYTTIQAQITGKKPSAVMVLGLEMVINLKQMFASVDQVREEFQKNCHFPLILWVNNRVQIQLTESAPNFENWGITKEFMITTEELANFLKDKAEQFFTGNFRLTRGEALALEAEIEAAKRDLQSSEELELEANLESLLGFAKDINNKKDRALEHYQKGLELWQQIGNLEKQGTLLSEIAFCYYLKAFKQPLKHRDWQKTRDYLQQALQAWEQAKRPDLVANSLAKFGRVLRKLEEWEQLKELAQKALTWHQRENRTLEIATDYVFLAEVALAQEQWQEAIDLAQEYPKIYHSTAAMRQVLDDKLSRCYFIKARAQRYLGEHQEAIKNLEIAEHYGYPPSDIQLYLNILNDLRKLYFDNQEYRKAFAIKQKYKTTEYQYSKLAFIGAGYLETKEISGFITENRYQNLPLEIVSSGRQENVEELEEWVKRSDKRVIVIYGFSGVGKSSLIKAGLFPRLQQAVIRLEKIIPVYIRSYTSWIEELGTKLEEALAEHNINVTNSLKSSESILEQLNKSQSFKLRFVLIFDQFEEFFFVADTEALRNKLFEFLGKCLDILTLKVIFSLRRDYLHLLLNRPGMKEISNDILSKNVLYRITNFSVPTAKSLIEKLTQQSNFRLEEDLIEQLVKDLAEKDDKIRPIELQVVGAQLQEDNIINLQKYKESGGKEELVKRYLASVVKDCGEENEKVANLILYLLTNEKGNRPLKTRAELEKELKDLGKDSTLEAENLDLVLDILVASGLVFQLPEIPDERYQLVHDYLVDFIREEQTSRLLEELETSQEINKQTEAELKQTRQQLEQLLQVVQRNRQRAEQERKQTEQVKKWLENAEVEALNLPFPSQSISGFTDYNNTLEMVINTLEKLHNFSQKLNLKNSVISINNILERVQTNSFSVAVVGEFNRGKSTFINALLGQEILPVDILLCTAAVTRVTYGVKPLAKIIFKDGREKEIAINNLADYVTMLTPESEEIAANVKEAVVYYPVYFCQNHVDLIDTPRLVLGKNHPETLSILPEVDVVIMVIMAQSPLSTVEQKLLETKLLTNDLSRIIFVVTGIDHYANSENAAKGINYIRDRIQKLILDRTKERYGEDSPEYEVYQKKMGSQNVFGLSAYQALQAKKTNDNELLHQSRFPEFEEALEKFLTQERGAAFLKVPINIIIRSATEILKTISSKQNDLELQQSELLDAYEKLFYEVKTQEENQIYFTNSIKKKIEKELKDNQISHQVNTKIFQILEKVQKQGYSKLTDIKDRLTEQYAKLEEEEIKLKPKRQELNDMAVETQRILSYSIRLSQQLIQQVNLGELE